MKIAIDISQIIYGTGVSVYTRKLVENLLAIDKENDYVLFGGSLRRRKEILDAFPQAKVFPIPPTLADIIWNKFHTLPIEKLLGKIDVFHSSDWAQPPSSAFKVTTVHDLYPIKFPRMVNPLVRDVHKRRLGWIISESDRVIVPSISTKNDLVDFGMREDKIRVIGEAPSLTKASPEEVDKTKRKLGINGDYVIAIGIGKLKNTKNIVRAFHLASPGKDVKLVLTGRVSDMEPVEERNVRIMGHVSQEDMGPLLTGSSGLIFASIYEGYGIPILDAFACGVPVVTSTTSSMPEVAGNAAVLVDPDDVNSIKEGIEKVLRGPKAYIDKGYARVAGFSWEKTAKETLAVYNESNDHRD
jgi:glycosyltransferase involved in cell wall biosynthesis